MQLSTIPTIAIQSREHGFSGVVTYLDGEKLSSQPNMTREGAYINCIETIIGQRDATPHVEHLHGVVDALIKVDCYATSLDATLSGALSGYDVANIFEIIKSLGRFLQYLHDEMAIVAARPHNTAMLAHSIWSFATWKALSVAHMIRAVAGSLGCPELIDIKGISITLAYDTAPSAKVVFSGHEMDEWATSQTRNWLNRTAT